MKQLLNADEYRKQLCVIVLQVNMYLGHPPPLLTAENAPYRCIESPKLPLNTEITNKKVTEITSVYVRLYVSESHTKFHKDWCSFEKDNQRSKCYEFLTTSAIYTSGRCRDFSRGGGVHH